MFHQLLKSIIFVIIVLVAFDNYFLCILFYSPYDILLSRVILSSEWLASIILYLILVCNCLFFITFPYQFVSVHICLVFFVAIIS